MSGICGILSLDGRPVDVGSVEAMAHEARHRGPHGTRVICHGSAGLTHLSLHLHPDDPRDPQPFIDGDLQIVADARIDNAAELSRLLAAELAGREPTTTPLLLAAFRRWGAVCVERLIGDYAFVVWDSRKRRVFAARDPSGIRSLHYRHEPGRFVFGTEVKQVLEAPDVPVRLFEPAVAGYLAGGYTKPHWTFYDGVTSLAPGHYLDADASGCRVQRFWDPRSTRSIRYLRDAEYAEHFRDLLGKAVAARIRSPRPVGVLLSGGMDSGSIASMGGHLVQRGAPSATPALRSYSFAFRELADCDERRVSDAIVREYGLVATGVPADDAWPLSGYPAEGPDRDSPFMWVYNRLLKRCVERASSDGVGVVLTGEGGDELMGDQVFDLAGLATSLRWRALWMEAGSLAEQRGTGRWKILRREVIGPMRRAARRAGPWGTSGRYPNVDPERPWVHPELARRTGISSLIRDDPRHRWSRLTARERRHLRLTSFHLPRLLSWQEHLHARARVGAAMPLADTRLVRYVLAIPPWVLNSPSEPKRLARRALRGIMPEPARRGARKVVPSGLFRRGMNERGVDALRDLLGARELRRRGFVNPTALQEQLEIHLSGKDPAYDLWYAATMEWWLRSWWGSE